MKHSRGAIRIAEAIIDLGVTLLELVVLSAIVREYEETSGVSFELEFGLVIDDEYDWC